MIQLQFLNRLLNSKDSSLIINNNLDESFFSEYVNEFRFIKNHLDNYGVVPDVATFMYTFDKFRLIEVNESNEYLLDELYRDKKSRTINSIFMHVKELFAKDKIDEAEQYCINSFEMLGETRKIEATDIIRDNSRYKTYVEKCRNIDNYYVTTGFKELDMILGGWDRREENATIVARPNVGKSYVLMKCSVDAAKQGLTVGIYEGEMSEDKVGYRVDTLIGNISNTALTHGNPSVDVEYKKYLEALPNSVKGSIHVLTSAKLKRFAGASDLKAFIMKYKLDILFVDQHSLLEDEFNGRGPVEKANNISKALKRLQVSTGVPIISVSQQNREKNEDGSVDLSMIAQSDRIGQDSTVVLFLEAKDDLLKIHVVKARDGGKGKTLSYKADFNLGTFQYINENEDGSSSTNSADIASRYNVGEDVF